jgi:hypothetical protein
MVSGGFFVAKREKIWYTVLMKRKFAEIVTESFSKAGIAVDVATRNPLDRIGREVDSGGISWEDGLSRAHSSARLYRLNASQRRDLESTLKKNFQ